MANCPLCYGVSKIVCDGTGKDPLLIKCIQCGFSIESKESIMDPDANLAWNEPFIRWWAVATEAHARKR